VVGSDNQIAYREIKVGDAHGNLRIVKSGIQPGERIVVSGTQRVRAGAKVSPHMVPMIDADAPGTPSARDRVSSIGQRFPRYPEANFAAIANG
jgi:multidrug efflux system membrane fusion protein